MIVIGRYNDLDIMRETPQGLYLEDTEGNEVLLPGKYVPEVYKIWETLRVFVYLDHEERPVATTRTPHITLGEFAHLCCVDVTSHGAFVDWGLEKQLFVPFAEQARPMIKGHWYMVHLFLDEKTNRLVASSKLRQFLSNDAITVQKHDQVSILVSHLSEKGANVIVNGKHEGLVYSEDIFEDIRPGDQMEAYVKKVRPDCKLDIVLQPEGYRGIEPNAQFVLDELRAAGGFLSLHDKSDPESIKNQLGMSKKSFKKAIGTLYKDQKIVILKNGIELKKA